MKSIVRAISTAAIAVAPALCLAQVVRLEVHPIQSVTMSDQDFLNGRKDAKPVLLAGQLKIPRAGSEAVSARAANCGWRREPGAERTSTSALTPAQASSAPTASAGPPPASITSWSRRHAESCRRTPPGPSS